MKKHHLPYHIQIAARATNLDKISIIPLDLDPGICQHLTTLNVWGSQKRLVQKAAQLINADIEKALLKNPEAKIYIYSLGNPFQKNWFVTGLDLHYEIK